MNCRAGGGVLAALHMLAKSKKIAKTFPVPQGCSTLPLRAG
jgi:hypothetical protein